jgi:hypothetical protein
VNIPVSMWPGDAQGAAAGVAEGCGPAVGGKVAVGKGVGSGGEAVKAVGTTAATALVGNTDGAVQAVSPNKR